MMSFVAKPNLPEKCSEVIIGQKYYPSLFMPLKNLNISVVTIPDDPYVDPRVGGHADLAVFHAGGEKWYFSEYLRESKAAQTLMQRGAEISFGNTSQSNVYPSDCAYNICVFGKKVICSERSDAGIVSFFTNSAYDIIRVKQGYARCSVCIVDEKAVITADRGIAEVCQSSGTDTLLIKPGYIELDGYDYGFIGGASFKISKHELAFTGSLDEHPDKSRIIAFLDKHAVRPVYITSRKIFDIGTAIPVNESADT